MYSIGGWFALLGRRRSPAERGTPRISANVVFLGLTSLLTDISSEMVVSVLPIYLVSVLRLSPVQFGLVDGLYQGVAAVVTLASGIVTDRWRRYKEVAGVGYALSAASRAGLLATTAWTGIAGLLVVDRFGKGIRTAPRDALISLSVPAERLGVAFGVHRAMDALGAMLGPVIAFAVLSVAPLAFDLIFAISLGIGIVGLATLGFFVENRQPSSPAGILSPGGSLTNAIGLLQAPGFRHLAVCAFLLGLTTISDAFVYLALQRQMNIGFGIFPLLYVLTSLGYLVLAVPVGQLSDRVGRLRVFLAGYALLLMLDATLLWAPPSVVAVGLAVLILGAHYAATEGVLMALGSALLPDGVRTSGLAVLTTATAVARLSGAILFGWIWTYWGLAPAVAAFLIGLAVALTAVLVFRPGREGSP